MSPLVLGGSIIEEYPVQIPLDPSTAMPAYRQTTGHAAGNWVASDPNFWLFAAFYELTTQRETITRLEDGYTVVRPIPVEIEPVDDATYLASFNDANIAISGTDAQDAYQSLVAEILDTFDTLTAEAQLAPAAAAQLAVLRAYIAKA